MRNAYAMSNYTKAKTALEKIFRRLERINPSAARSLEEGLEETLTVHRLGIGAVLRRPDRIVLVDGATRGAERKALARRKSTAALDGYRALGGGETLPTHQRLSRTLFADRFNYFINIY